MSKLKSNSAMKKRIKITGSGKFFHNKCGKSHLFRNKNKAHRQLKYGKQIDKTHTEKVEYLLPYSL